MLEKLMNGPYSYQLSRQPEKSKEPFNTLVSSQSITSSLPSTTKIENQPKKMKNATNLEQFEIITILERAVPSDPKYCGVDYEIVNAGLNENLRNKKPRSSPSASCNNFLAPSYNTLLGSAETNECYLVRCQFYFNDSTRMFNELLNITCLCTASCKTSRIFTQLIKHQHFICSIEL